VKKFLSVLVLIVIGGWSFIGCTKEKAGQVVEYDFETGVTGWHALGKAQIAQDTTRQHDGKASMKIAGTGQSGLWSFAQSDKIKMESGKSYRFSGWMLIDSISENTSHFKCEFWQDGKWLKNVESVKYDLIKKGQWQELTAEFTVPDEKGILLDFAIEKRPMEKNIEAAIYIDSIKLQMVK
jgi:hypothetical protein